MHSHQATKFFGSGLAAVAALLLLSAVPTAYAGDMSAAIGYTRYKTDLKLEGNTNALCAPTCATYNLNDVDEITLTLAEAITPSFSIALQGGYTEAILETIPANPAIDEVDTKLTGHLVGLLAKYKPTLISGWLSLDILAAYRRHNLDDIQWNESKIKIGPVLNLGPVDLSAGGYAVHYNGTYPGIEFGAKKTAGAFGSVAFEVSGDSYVSLYGRSGPEQGYGIRFSGGF